MPIDLTRRLPRFNPPWMALALAIVFALGVFDHLSGAELSFSIFYLLPISLAAWNAGFGAGVVVAFATALMLLMADYFSGFTYSHPLILYWNGLARFGFLVVTVWLIEKTKRLTVTLEDKARTLTEQIAERKRAEE